MTSNNETELFHARVRAALGQLDGTHRGAVRLLTGATDAEVDDLGGIQETTR